MDKCNNLLFDSDGHVKMHVHPSVYQAEFVILDMINGIYEIRLWWDVNGYYFFRMSALEGYLYTGFVERGVEHIYKAL